MAKFFAAVCLLATAACSLFAMLTAQVEARPPSQPMAIPEVTRKYALGQTLVYEMNGSNQGWNYQIQATDVTKRDPAGVFYEEISWSQLKSNATLTMSPGSLAFRQTVSLSGMGKYMAIPDLGLVDRFLIGPITDMLTFYSDLLICKQLKLTHVGAHGYFEHGSPNSWADGQHVLLGEDSIDFDVTLIGLNPTEHMISFVIRHLPPKRPRVNLIADWMSRPIADAPNNWVQVEKDGDKYKAQVGKETFEVRIDVDTTDGKILRATLYNPIEVISRDCEDAASTHCGPSSPEQFARKVTLTLKKP